MKKLFLLTSGFWLLASVLGCASVSQHATTTTTNPTNGVVTVTDASTRIVAVGDAKNVVEKIRASAGKTASVGASGVSEESSTDGLVEIFKAVFEAGKASAVK